MSYIKGGPVKMPKADTHGDTFLVAVGIVKKKGTRVGARVASLLVPQKALLLKLNLSNKKDLWEVTKTFSEVGQLHKVLRKEFPEIDVPALPRVPHKAKNFDSDEWFNFFRILLDDPTFSESGFLRTFLSTQDKSDEVMHTQFGEVVREGPLIFQKKSAKYKKLRHIECWCVIRLRMFFFYRTRFDASPMGMIALDDCTVELSTDKSPKDSLVVAPKAYKAIGMPLEDSIGNLEPPQPEQKTPEGHGAHKPELESITLVPKGSAKHTFLASSVEERDQWLNSFETVAKSRVTTHFRVVSTLLVQIEKGVHLIAKDTNGFSDPYAIVHIENQQYKTATIKKSLDPVWHETFQFHVSWYSAVLYLSVWDEDNLKSADFLGKLAIPVAALPVDEEIDIWQALSPRRAKNRVSGLVHLRMKYSFTLEEEEKEDKAHTKIFGMPLNADQPIPPQISETMKYVESRGLDVEGLFRLSANTVELNELKRSLDQGAELDFSRSNNIHNWSGLVKLWLRELPEPALTYDAYPKFLSALRESSSENRLPNLKSCLQSLPPAHKALLAEILPFLHRVAQAHEKTRMTTTNLAVVFSPSLLRSRVESLDSLMADSSDVSRVVALLIEHANVLIAA